MLAITSCGTDNVLTDLIFPVTQDAALGAQLDSQIMSDPTTYPILSRSAYPQVYTYLEDMRDAILESEDIENRDQFAWKLTVIDDDVLNAFAAPGGYIYIYTGLIEFLDNADDLAGVLGHEIAHADQRHSVDQLIANQGIDILRQLVLGENGGGAAAQVVAGLLSLRFSRTDETEADEFSVRYLEETDYACNGAASFFIKLEEQDTTGGGTPEFLSTHPDPDNRVEYINTIADMENCDRTAITETGSYTYSDLKADLRSTDAE